MLKMSDWTRDLIVLCGRGGKSPCELAEATKKTEGTVLKATTIERIIKIGYKYKRKTA